MVADTIVLPVFYACYLINGDTDNYSSDELKEMQELEREFGGFVGVDFETQNFSTYKGLGCDVCEYTFLTKEKPDFIIVKESDEYVYKSYCDYLGLYSANFRFEVHNRKARIKSERGVIIADKAKKDIKDFLKSLNL